MRKFALFAVLLVLTACSMAPKFENPVTNFPSAFKEEGVKELGTWKAAAMPCACDKGKWWLVFNDKTLNALQEEAIKENQSLKIAAARLAEARAVAGQNIADRLPNVGLGFNAARSDAGNVPAATPLYSVHDLKATATWEPDFWGKARDTEKAYAYAADAQEAAYQDALLSLQADVAQTYFAIRAFDAERALLRKTINVYAKSAQIMGARNDIGEVGAQDSSRAQSELDGARAQLTALDRQRAALEHAQAVLLGKIPSGYDFKEKPLAGAPPRIPAGLPATLLERRPDVAAALHDMAAANARIGAARAAFLPDISLTASGGFQSAVLGKLFDWTARAWALGQVGGLALTLPIFDHGRRSSAVDAARARYDGALATYRQQVLAAFRDVEDKLTDQRLLRKQSGQADSSASSAHHAAVLARKRYDAGSADYFEVVDAERVALAAGRAAVQTRGQRYISSVALIRALGGGWK